LEVLAFSRLWQGAALPGLQLLPGKLCAVMLVKERRRHYLQEVQVL